MTKARDLANASTALSAVDATELGYLDGVTSNIQTQFGNISGSKAQPTEPASPTDGMIWVDTDGAVTDAQYIAKSLLTTTGDTIYASGTNTPARLGIGSTGQILTVSGGVPVWGASPAPAFVGASVYNSANVTINHNTYTQIPFNSELFDTDNFHSTTTNNSRFTIPSGKDGKYQFTFAILADPYGVAAKNVTRLYKNGSGGKITVFDSNASDDSNFFLQGIESAVAGDYFEIYCLQNTGTNRNASGGTTYMWFSIQYLGA